MRKASIRIRILVPIITVLLVGIALMVVIASVRSSRTANSLSFQVVDETVDHYAASLEANASGAMTVAQSLAPVVERMRAVPGSRDALLEVFEEILLRSEGIVGVWTAWEPNAYNGDDASYRGADYHDADGRFVPYVHMASGSVAIEALQGYDDPVAGEYYQGPKASGKIHFSAPYYYDTYAGQILIYSISVPIFDKGAVAGVVGVDVNLATLAEIMNAASILDEGYLFTLNPNGLVATNRDDDLIMQSYKTTWLAEHQDRVDSILASGGGFQDTLYADKFGENVLLSVQGVELGEDSGYWAVCGLVPESAVKHHSRSLVWLIVIVGIVMVVVIGVSVVLIVGKNLGGLSDLTAAAKSLAEGNVMQVNLGEVDQEDTRNEVEQLKQAFSAMVANTREQAMAVERIASGDLSIEVQPKSNHDVLNHALREMVQMNNRAFHDIQTSAIAVQTGSRQIAEGAQILASATSIQSSSMEELSAAVKDVAAKAEENEEIAVKAASLSEQILTIADSGSEKMHHLTQAVSDINEASKKIESVIKVIDDIAFQTNILSLNAAVEAARAGQHGKGFAVVADEVRDLANKSAEAARNTGTLISDSIKKAELGAEITGETADRLEQIVSAVKESGELVRRIPQYTKEQTTAIEQINIGIEQVSASTQQNSSTAEQSAATSEELSGQADLLQQLVASFQLSDDVTGNVPILYAEDGFRPDAFAMAD